MLKKIKIAGITFISCCTLALPLAAKADLTIVNNTNQDSSSVINNGRCSNILGAVGITRAHTVNTVPQSIVNFVCMSNKTECKADVYMTSNCQGPIIARAVFNTTKGIADIKNNYVGGYVVTGAGFHIDIVGDA